MHLRVDVFQTGGFLYPRPGHVHDVKTTLGVDDQRRLRNPLRPLQRAQKHAIELGGLLMASRRCPVVTSSITR